MLNIKNSTDEQQRFISHAFYVLVFLFVCRIIASYFIPLNDTTEARYAEIARKMLETANWITLQHEYGVPFWAKPPLSTWLSACSMKLFGVNEFAARLPELLLSSAVLWLIWDIAKKHSGITVATIAALVLAGTVSFFLDAGAVMTDPSLLFCTTLTMVAFWYALVTESRLWGYLFFTGLGLGLLAKGPIALIITGTPVFFWILLRNEWHRLWAKLPWIKGILLLSCISFPWYIWAEMRTPGFLNYFIVGEHLQRFLTPGWAGDRYGIAHYAPKGMIWLYAIVGFLPWSMVGGIWLVRQGRKFTALYQDDDGWMSYLMLCLLTPLLFFTFAGNIIYPYIFPALPAFALFFAELCHRYNSSLRDTKWVLFLSMLCGIGALAITGVFIAKPQLIAKTQKEMIRVWKDQHPATGSHLIYWDSQTPFSAQFYSAGRATSTDSIQRLCSLLSNQQTNYLVIDVNKIEEIPKYLFSQFITVATVTVKKDKFFLLESPVRHC